MVMEEERRKMKRNVKLVILLALAAATMAALVFVNLQAGNDGRPRRPGITAPVLLPDVGAPAGVPGQGLWVVSDHEA
jgi:hypothetical protein